MLRNTNTAKLFYIYLINPNLMLKGCNVMKAFKRIITCVMLAATMIVVPVIAVSSSPYDLNDDGSVDVKDLIRLMKVIAAGDAVEPVSEPSEGIDALRDEVLINGTRVFRQNFQSDNPDDIPTYRVELSESAARIYDQYKTHDFDSAIKIEAFESTNYRIRSLMYLRDSQWIGTINPFIENAEVGYSTTIQTIFSVQYLGQDNKPHDVRTFNVYLEFIIVK